MNYKIKLFTENPEKKIISNYSMFFCFTAALCHKLAICKLKLNAFQIYTLNCSKSGQESVFS